MPSRSITLKGIAGAEVRTDKRVQFPELGDEPVGTDGHIAVKQTPCRVGLDQPGHHDHAQVAGDFHERCDRGTVGNRLGQIGKLVPTQMLQKRVTTDGAFVKADNLGPLLDRPPGQLFDPGQVVCLVAIAMLKLGGSDSNISHSTVLSTRPKR